AFPLLPGDQLTEATGRSTGLSGHLKCKYYFIYFLTLASDAALTSTIEEMAFQCSRREPWTISICFNFSEESSGKANDFSSCSFLKKIENFWKQLVSVNLVG
uniref:Uncharacterized protein n=1 Tax=Aquila chrysaetos chrysaetos TaxID=223781 RepID=A0A663F0S7_AQUCH